MIVWISSYPRSGNALVRMSLFYYWNIASSEIYVPDPGNEHLSSNELFGSLPPRAPKEEDARSGTPYYFKTHELPSDNHPALYIYRNGLDAVYSYACFIRQMYPDKTGPYSEMSLDEIGRLLITNPNFFGGWSQHITAWKNREGPCSWLRYEDLLDESSRLSTIERALDNLGLNYSSTGKINLPSVEHLRSNNPLLFRKGERGDGTRSFSTEIQDLFLSYHGETFEELGYPLN